MFALTNSRNAIGIRGMKLEIRPADSAASITYTQATSVHSKAFVNDGRTLPRSKLKYVTGSDFCHK